MRDEIEFQYGGEAEVVRPEPGVADEEAWAKYLFLRNNTKGWVHEQWAHVHGCGQWFNVLRHTVTHEIRASYRLDALRPDVET